MIIDIGATRTRMPTGTRSMIRCWNANDPEQAMFQLMELSLCMTMLWHNKGTAANPAGAQQLQFTRSVSRVAELGVVSGFLPSFICAIRAIRGQLPSPFRVFPYSAIHLFFH